MGALRTGADHLWLALAILTQNAALKIQSTGRFFQRGRRTYAQASGQSGGGLPRQGGQQRLHQLIKGHDGRNRIAGKAAEPTVRQAAKSKRFTGFHRQLPEANHPQLFQHRFGKVGFTHRDAAGADDHISLAIGFSKGATQCSGIVFNNAEIDDLASQLVQHQRNRKAVGVVDLPGR